MTPTRKRRLIYLLLILAGVAVAGGITFWSLQQNLLYFQSPSEVQAMNMPSGRQFRLGGLVETGSTQRDPGGLQVSFVVTDGQHSIPVSYEGILPDLFREGQGVIARGRLDDSGHFTATEVLAKHDENYMPPEVADALKKAGHPGPVKAGTGQSANDSTDY